MNSNNFNNHRLLLFRSKSQEDLEICTPFSKKEDKMKHPIKWQMNELVKPVFMHSGISVNVISCRFQK